MAAYGTVLDGALDDFRGLGVHPDVARAVDHAIVLEGLGELRERLGCRGREDYLWLGWHFEESVTLTERWLQL